MNRIFHNLRPQIGSIFTNNLPHMTQVTSRTMATMERLGQRVPVKVKPDANSPTKFTESEAYINYRASDNFYGGDDRDLPPSHNYVFAGSFILGIYYLIFLRDDVDAGGGKDLLKPLHETVPELGIPLIRAAIAEHERLGYSTAQLKKKLAELLEESDKHGGTKNKLTEN